MVRLKFLSHFVDAVHSSSGWSSDDIGVVIPVLAKSESNFNSSTTSSLETTMHRKLVALISRNRRGIQWRSVHVMNGGGGFGLSGC